MSDHVSLPMTVPVVLVHTGFGTINSFRYQREIFGEDLQRVLDEDNLIGGTYDEIENDLGEFDGEIRDQDDNFIGTFHLRFLNLPL